MIAKARKIVSLRRGKSYTTSSRQTPPGSEGSKGTMVERCDIRGLPFFNECRNYECGKAEFICY